MRRSVPILLWLVVVWVALWGEVSPANLLGGLAVAAFTLALAPPRPAGEPLTVRPLPALKLIVYFLWQLVVASAVVAWEVATPRNRIREAIVAVPLTADSDLINTLIANAVSLTPGSLSLEMVGRPAVLYVHVLHLKDIDDVRRQIGRLEELAIKALAARRQTSGSSSGGKR